MVRGIAVVIFCAAVFAGIRYGMSGRVVDKQEDLVVTGSAQERSGYKLVGGSPELCHDVLGEYVLPYGAFGFDGSVVLTDAELASVVIDASTGLYEVFSGDIRIGYISGMMTGGYNYGKIMLQEFSSGVFTLGAYGEHDGQVRYTLREFTGIRDDAILGWSHANQDYDAQKQAYASSSGIRLCQYQIPFSGGVCDALYVRVRINTASYASYYTQDPIYTIDCFVRGNQSVYHINVAELRLPDPMTPVSESVLAQKTYNHFVMSLFGTIRK